jgi:16S rRNA (guanine(966)-N(2))-methyltransferase RsmD
MRIIGGTWGGRRLASPPGSGTRPTADRVREALFSILGPPPRDTVVLDLFAGAGGLGLEALSRGATRAVFVEAALGVVKVLRKNIQSLGADSSCEVHSSDAQKALPRLLRAGTRFTWVFLDPPYRSALSTWALVQLGTLDMLSENAVVVCEHDKRLSPADAYGSLERQSERRYGDTHLSLFRRGPGAAMMPRDHGDETV